MGCRRSWVRIPPTRPNARPREGPGVVASAATRGNTTRRRAVHRPLTRSRTMPETPPPDPAPRGAGAARDAGLLEARLKAAREKRGLSLTDVQQETRIPADVLQRL